MPINRRIKTPKVGAVGEYQSKTNFLTNIVPLINQGIVIPIISNSFRIEQIFLEEREDAQQNLNMPTTDDEELTIQEQLTKLWAESENVGYPMLDKHDLARIAQYHLVETKDNYRARADYVDFLKQCLLDIGAQDDSEYESVVSRFKKHIHEVRFSEIVRQLDSPRFPVGVQDPLRLLARLPLPIYVTTSYYDFLEQALEFEGKTPVTQVCFWSGGKSSIRTNHKENEDFMPSATHPVVYHLFGLEDYPKTLVLSEDDYINFLVSVVEDTDTQNPVIPLRLRGALADFHLLLLGYQLHDWEFRILFRVISKFRGEDSPRGIVIQLKPDQKRIGDEEKARKYLSDYFDKKAFHFEWTDSESFIRKLWDEWIHSR